jgi:hypothetical protein
VISHFKVVGITSQECFDLSTEGGRVFLKQKKRKRGIISQFFRTSSQ